MYITDANVEEAIRRGADEIWAIWTVSTRDEWRDGFVEQYFQIIETVADAQLLRHAGSASKQNNAAIAAGNAGEFGRTIKLKLLQAEVPMHYLFNFSRDRMAEAVNLGVDDGARVVPRARSRSTSAAGHAADAGAPTTSTLQFTEADEGLRRAGGAISTNEDSISASRRTRSSTSP